jgi:hypothetical protein
MSAPIGISFSPQQISHLGLDADQSLRVAIDLHFAHIRLGTHWSEIEKEEGVYDFSQLHHLLNICEKAHQPVVLTVGVKAPRWPEFYWPDWLPAEQRTPANTRTQEKILQFLMRAVMRSKKISCITHWQIENEPLDPSGPENLALPLEFLQKEVELVKNIDQRPVLLTAWGNALSQRGFFAQLATIADIVGIDVYYQQFVAHLLGKSLYAGPRDADQKIQQIIDRVPKPVWITELQAEPWEKDDFTYRAGEPKSMSPRILKENLLRAPRSGAQEILLWGFEYWLYREKIGDTRYMQLIKNSLQNS